MDTTPEKYQQDHEISLSEPVDIINPPTTTTDEPPWKRRYQRTVMGIFILVCIGYFVMQPIHALRQVSYISKSFVNSLIEGDLSTAYHYLSPVIRKTVQKSEFREIYLEIESTFIDVDSIKVHGWNLSERTDPDQIPDHWYILEVEGKIIYKSDMQRSFTIFFRKYKSGWGIINFNFGHQLEPLKKIEQFDGRAK